MRWPSLSTRKPEVLVYGPGLGSEPEIGRFALELMSVAEGRFATLCLMPTASPRFRILAAFFEAKTPECASAC